MLRESGIFCRLNRTKKILHFFSLILILVTWSFGASAAGYTCPTQKKYTSCSSGYYLSECGASSNWNGQTIASSSLKAGNSCIKGTNSAYTYPGGTVCPKPNKVTCAAGKYLPANKSSTSDCTTCEIGYYCPGGTFTPNSSSVQGRSSCVGNATTSSTGQTSVSACICKAGYGGNAASTSGSCTACTTGRYKSSNGNTACSVASIGYYVSTTGATSQSACTSWRANTTTTGTGSTSTSACVCKGGYRLNSTTCTACSTGTYKSAASNATSCTSAGIGYYVSTTGATSQSACTAWRANTTTTGTGSTSTSACVCKGGYRLNSTTCTACSTGTYKSAASNATSCTSAGIGYYVSTTGATSQSACTSWRANTSTTGTGSTSTSACVCNIGYGWNGSACASCGAGTYKTSKANSACSSCGAGYYCTGGSHRASCSSISGVSVAGGSYTSVSPYNASSTCRYTAPAKTIGGCKTVTSNQVSYSGSAWGTSTYSVTANPGYIIANNNTANATCSQCNGAVWSAGGTATSCSGCPAQTSGWTRNSGAGWSAVTQCNQTKNVGGNCSAGVLRQNATSTTAWGASTISTALQAKAGYIVNGQTCTGCSAGTYSAGGTATSCSACTTRAKYSGANASACTNVSSGYYTTGCNTSGNNCTGQAQCTGATYCSGGVNNNCPGSYTANTTNGKTAATQCTINVGAGKHIGTANSSTISNCAAGQYRAAHTVNYGSTSSCSSCPSGYTSNAGSAGAETSCYINVAGGKYLGTEKGTTLSTCAAGTYKAAHTVNYGSKSSCAACTGATFSGAGAASCTNCPSGYTANTASNKTANTQCQISVSGGHYIGASGQNSGNWGTCAAGTSKAAHTVNYGSTSSCGVCTANNTYSAAGATSCSTCPTGYANTGTTAAAHANAASCKISVAAGKYLATANGTALTSCAAGKYKAAHSVSYGSTSSCDTCGAGTYSGAGAGSCSACSGTLQYQDATGQSSCKTVSSGYYKSSNSAQTQCPANYRNGGAAANISGCTASCAAGSRVTTANGACTAITTGNVYMLAHNVTYGKTSAAATSCPGGYSISGTSQTDHDAKNDCKINCGAGTRVASTDATCSGVGNGYYIAAHTVSAGSISGAATQCPAAYPNSDAGAGVITKCYSGQKSRAWTGGQTACDTPANSYGHTCNSCSNPACSYVAFSNSAGNGDGTIKTGCGTNNAACKQTVKSFTCNAAYYVNGAACSACSGLGGGFYPNSAAGNTGGATACKTNNLAGQYIATANATSATDCGAGKYKAAHQVAYGSTSACSTASAGHYAPGPRSASQTQCVAGSYSTAGASGCTACGAGKTSAAGATAASACTNCTAIANINTWATPVWNTNNTMSNLCSVATCNGASYKNGNTCPTCPPNYGVNTATGKTSIGQCQTSCAAGYAVQNVNEACKIIPSGYQTGTHRIGYGSKTPTAVDSTSPKAGTWYSCPTNYSATGTAATDHDARIDCKISCGAGTRIVTADAASCTTPAGNWWVGAHTVGAGTISTVNNCLNNYTIAGTAATDHDAAADCKISCGGGYYIAAANATSCSSVGAGYWTGASVVSQGSTGSRTACASGLTTIGYGAGADESGDCGRIMHFGDSKLYLRSTKKTTPSLNVKVGDKTYYGNMSTSTKGKLRIKKDATTYSVHDDSM